MVLGVADRRAVDIDDVKWSRATYFPVFSNIGVAAAGIRET